VSSQSTGEAELDGWNCCRRDAHPEPLCSDEAKFSSMLPATATQLRTLWTRASDPPAAHARLDPRIPSGCDPLPRIKDILADLNRSTSRVHLPLTTVPAKAEFRRVVCRMLNAAMATEPTGPTTRSYLTSTGLRKIEPYRYPYTTMAKGRWLGREMLEVVSTEFRDRSIDYYVSPQIFARGTRALKQHPRSCPEICPSIRGDHHQRGDRQTRHYNPER
jgi:hypothetical protein